MKILMLLFFSVLLFTQCKIFKPGEGKSGTVSKRFNRPDGSDKNNAPDSVVVTGSQYIPMLGKSETGVNPTLEGTWVLESMDGYSVKGDVIKRLDSIAATKVKIAENRPEVTFNNDAKITPPQGSNYHIPDRPNISFYGANETFSGFTGCNKYSGRYVLADSNTLSLKEAAPSTRMVCLGDYDEATYIDKLHSINKFKGGDDKLELMDGDKVLMTFSRKKEK